MRFLTTSALALALLAGCAPTSSNAPVDPHAVQVGQPGPATCLATPETNNRQAAARTNAARQRVGLAPVQPNTLLAQVAARHACDMAKRGRMTHHGSSSTGPGARLRAAGYQPRISAENIAAGPFSLGRVLHEWDVSPGHRANIMLPQVSDYGIGEAIAADGRTRYWAAVYAAPR